GLSRLIGIQQRGYTRAGIIRNIRYPYDTDDQFIDRSWIQSERTRSLNRPAVTEIEIRGTHRPARRVIGGFGKCIIDGISTDVVPASAQSKGRTIFPETAHIPVIFDGYLWIGLGIGLFAHTAIVVVRERGHPDLLKILIDRTSEIIHPKHGNVFAIGIDIVAFATGYPVDSIFIVDISQTSQRIAPDVIILWTTQVRIHPHSKKSAVDALGRPVDQLVPLKGHIIDLIVRSVGKSLHLHFHLNRIPLGLSMDRTSVIIYPEDHFRWKC